MKKHFAVVFILVISSQILFAETSRPTTQSAKFSKDEFSLPADAKIGARLVAEQVTTEAVKLGSKESKGKLENVTFAAIVITSVELDYKGELLSFHIVRGAKFDPSYDKKAEAMIRQVGKFKVPAHYSGGKFMVTFLFEKNGRFKMKTLLEEE